MTPEQNATAADLMAMKADLMAMRKAALYKAIVLALLLAVPTGAYVGYQLNQIVITVRAQQHVIANTADAGGGIHLAFGNDTPGDEAKTAIYIQVELPARVEALGPCMVALYQHFQVNPRGDPVILPPPCESFGPPQ